MKIYKAGRIYTIIQGSIHGRTRFAIDAADITSAVVLNLICIHAFIRGSSIRLIELNISISPPRLATF